MLLVYGVYVKHITLCNCRCSSFSSIECGFTLKLVRDMIITYSLLVVFLPALSGISGNSEQKTILHTTKQLIQYMVLGIQFRSLKYTAVIRIRKNLSNFPFIPKRYKARSLCWCKQPASNSFQTLQTIYTYSNCTIDQLLYFWQMFQPTFAAK